MEKLYIMETKTITDSSIKALNPNSRPVLNRTLGSLMESMNLIGLKTPITVHACDNGYEVVTGNHRLCPCAEVFCT